MRRRGRLDKFSNQIYSNSIRVEARPNHTFATEQFLDASYSITARTERDDDEEKDYEDEDVNRIPNARLAHFPRVQDTDLRIRPSIVNHCADKCYVIPQSSNVQDVRPKNQLQLLPYLCEDAQVDAIIREETADNVVTYRTPNIPHVPLLDGVYYPLNPLLGVLPEIDMQELRLDGVAVPVGTVL